MKVELADTPISQTPVDLLAVVLDDAKTLHDIDDPAIRGHVERAAAGFRAKTLKREYYATLPDAAQAKAVVVYWSPQLKSWDLRENVKTFTARALRLARDYRLPRVGLLLNTQDATSHVAGAVEGGVIATHPFDKYKQEKDALFARDASLTILVLPGSRKDAEAHLARSAWVAENVNNNISAGGLAGAITAGLFLREFVENGAAWAHLDVAGAAGFRDKEWKYFDAGTTGFGVKTLVDFCERFREPLPRAGTRLESGRRIRRVVVASHARRGDGAGPDGLQLQRARGVDRRDRGQLRRAGDASRNGDRGLLAHGRAFIMLGAKIGERLGAKRVFLASVALFGAAMGLVAVSPTVGTLIAAQGLAGLAAAALVPTLVVLIASHYEGRQRAEALGWLGASQAMAGVLAFLVAGILGTWTSWRYSFALLVVLAAATLLTSSVLASIVSLPLRSCWSPESSSARPSSRAPKRARPRARHLSWHSRWSMPWSPGPQSSRCS